MARLPTPCLSLVTDRNITAGRDLEEVVEAAVAGGVDLVQLREKERPAGDVYLMAERLRAITRGKALLFVNDRVDIALAAECDGVQLGENAMPTSAARAVCGGSLLIGRSVHSLEGAKRAEADGADLLVLGTIFPTGSHPGAATAGVELVQAVAEEVSVPVLAIGGINHDNVAAVIRAGASGVALISAISGSPDPETAASALKGRMLEAWTQVEAKGSR
ncbi:MAG: thiamine phosphate synthase [Chloroflexi bacterium]|nr:thiamine phosphate synthase [Chloroflexota bacterium]